MTILTPRQWREAMARHGTFDRDQIDKTLRRVMSALASDKQPQDLRWPLLIVGEAGSGKTCAALLYCDHWCSLYGYQFFATARDFCQRVADAKCDRLEAGGYKVWLQDVWKEWTDAGLAVLDDLGSREKVSDSQYETVLDCLDKRQNKPTVYTSNADLEELGKVYDDRVASRLSAGTVCHVKGDRRQHEQPDLSKYEFSFDEAKNQC